MGRSGIKRGAGTEARKESGGGAQRGRIEDKRSRSLHGQPLFWFASANAGRLSHWPLSETNILLPSAYLLLSWLRPVLFKVSS